MEIIQINHNNHTTYTGAHEIPGIQERVEQHVAQREQAESAFHDFVDNAPNRNAEYTEDLRRIQEHFAQDGLEIAPIIILDPEDYAQAMEIAEVHYSGGLGGIYAFGRALVQYPQYPQDYPYYQASIDTTVRDLMIHEAAHSTSVSDNDPTAVVITNQIGDAAIRTVFGKGDLDTASFGKINVSSHNTSPVYGSMLEEAFADLTRVRYKRDFGWAPEFEGKEFSVGYPDDNVVYVNNPNQPVINEEGKIRLPIDFAMGATINYDQEGQRTINASWAMSNLAAYGLELLDKRVPGLYDTMVAARKNPKLQRDVIRMINSVQPGLYKNLRNLNYSHSGKDFIEGFHAIAEALESSES